MFYGNSIFKYQENCDLAGSSIYESSICTAEYNNRLIMYENCTDEYDKVILEAQLEVLYELSISEIWKKIKKWIRDRLLAIVKWLEKLFSEGKQTKFKSDILQLLKSAKKALENVEKAETKEEIENCKKEYESLNNECKGGMQRILNLIDENINFSLNKGDDESAQIYRQFKVNIIDIYKRMDDAKNEDEADKIEQEFEDLIKQHEENINNLRAQRMAQNIKDKWTAAYNSRPKDSKYGSGKK